MKKDYNNIFLWLNRPVPFYETTRQKMLVSIAFGIFITGFLILFDYSPEKESSYLQLIKALIYGVLTFLVLFLFNFLFPLVIPNFFNPEKWNMGKSILFGILIVVSIGLVNALFAFRYDNPNNRTQLYSFTVAVVQRTFLISIIPTFIFNIWLERRFYKKYYSKAKEVSENLKEVKSTNDNKIYLGNDLVFFESQLVYIKAEGNYCQVHYIDQSNQKKVLVRATLKNLEQSLNKNNRIVRCHKSYVVNLEKVIQVIGNAKGYSFIVDEFNYPVPVSREISKQLLEKITQYSN